MRITWIAAVFILLCSPAFVLALSSEDIRSHGVLRVGMSGDYAPFCVCLEPVKEYTGFEVEAARRLAADLGISLVIVRFRWPELRQDLAAARDVAKQVQRFLLDHPDRMPAWARGFDLDVDVRPALPGLNEQLVNLLSHGVRISTDRASVIRAAETEISGEGVDETGKQRLGEAVWRVLIGRRC